MKFLILTILGLFLVIGAFNLLYFNYGRHTIKKINKMYNANKDKRKLKEFIDELRRDISIRVFVAFVSMVTSLMCIRLSNGVLNNKVSLIVVLISMLVMNICAVISLKNFWEVIKIADKFTERTSEKVYRRRRFNGNGTAGEY